MRKIFMICSFLLFLVGCGYSEDKSYQTPQPSPSNPQDPGKPLSGQALFASKCSSCHGGSTPNIGGKDETDIKRALASISAMKRVTVTDAEIKAIASYLGTLFTTDKQFAEDQYDDKDSEDVEKDR